MALKWQAADRSPFDLSGKSAIVTGAAMGIGFGISSALAHAGANVLMADIDEQVLANSQTLSSDGRRSVGILADVSDPGCGALLAERAVAEFGSVDILVNNAGVFPAAALADITPEHFDKVIG
jgi:NAD(P)-dependent dehydrogenase (short-subunit alcohol dehydrogenase family)